MCSEIDRFPSTPLYEWSRFWGMDRSEAVMLYTWRKGSARASWEEAASPQWIHLIDQDMSKFLSLSAYTNPLYPYPWMEIFHKASRRRVSQSPKHQLVDQHSLVAGQSQGSCTKVFHRILGALYLAEMRSRSQNRWVWCCLFGLLWCFLTWYLCVQHV